MATERFTGAQNDAQPGAVDLTGKEFFACKRTTAGLNLCAAGESADGVISEGKAAGLSTSFHTGNQLKAIAGAAVAVGAKVTTDASSRFITATSGTNICGKAMSAAAAAGELFTIDWDDQGVLA